uniref:SET domain-containing protein n=1 Tax=Dicentrarchus labrax TaxID=13489 RepID=A0A8P4GA03_DICLA
MLTIQASGWNKRKAENLDRTLAERYIKTVQRITEATKDLEKLTAELSLQQDTVQQWVSDVQQRTSGSSMAAVRRRKSPKTDAVEHAAKALDKTAELEVKYINSFKGRGVFAKAHFHKGDFVVEYRGELINSEESQRRRRTYHVKCTVFMFDFHWQERTWCIDAAREDGSLGRLVNDDHNHPNCKMKKVISEGKPHLCLFALRDINVGEEITYDYGGTDWPWRKKVGGPLTVTESSHADISRTKDQDPDRSTCSQNQ